AGFLQEAPPSGAPAWLPDLARLEWARVEVFDAPDATPFGPEDLKAIDAADWPGLRLRPTGALEVVESAWPIHAIWQGGGDPPPSPTSLRVWREEGAVYHCPLDPLEREALAGLRSGASFGGICEALAHLDPDAAAAEAGSILARWLDDGLIVGMELGNGDGEWSWEQSGGWKNSRPLLTAAPRVLMCARRVTGASPASLRQSNNQIHFDVPGGQRMAASGREVALMATRIRPLADRLIVKRVEEQEQKSAGGI